MRTNVNAVILTYKPDDKLFRLLDMMKKQTVKPGKIIIMNTEETFFPDDKLKSLRLSESLNIEIHHIKKQDFDHGNTRNAGASYADGDCGIIIFFTMDAVPYDEKLVENIIKPFSDDKTGASYARQLAGNDSSLIEKFTRNFNYPDKSIVKSEKDIETLGIKAFFCSNVCCAYRMDIFTSLGGFVQKAIFNEDMVYARGLLKAGYNIAYAADAKVIHTHEYTGRQQFKRNFDLAVSQKMNPDVFGGISSEKEGLKYVKDAFKYFCRHKRPHLIIPFGVGCVYKYAGYRKGLKYESLPPAKLRKYSMNPEFFTCPASDYMSK